MKEKINHILEKSVVQYVANSIATVVGMYLAFQLGQKVGVSNLLDGIRDIDYDLGRQVDYTVEMINAKKVELY